MRPQGAFFAAAFITALATWMAIPLYYLGVATGNRAATVWVRPATVLGAAVGGALVFHVFRIRAVLFPLDVSRVLVLSLLAGPVVFLALRRLRLVLTRSGRSPR